MKYIFYILIFLFLGLLIFNQAVKALDFLNPEVIYTTDTLTITNNIIKEFTAPAPPPIVTEKVVEIKVPYYIGDSTNVDSTRIASKDDSIKINIPVSKYEGTVDLDDVKLKYSHNIAGRLIGDSKYTLTFPERTTIIDTKETTVRSRALFLGLGVTSKGTVKAGVNLVNEKWSIGYNIGKTERIEANPIPVIKSEVLHEITVRYRIFGN